MAPTRQLDGRDVVIVASAGGVGAVSELVAGLPRDLPASVFVVMRAVGRERGRRRRRPGSTAASIR